MEYAITAHAAGHDVTIFEASHELGGVMNWAGNYKTLRNMEQIAYQPQWHRLMVAKAGIAVRLNTELTVETILADKPDVVVTATGAKPMLPDVLGLSAALASGFARTIDRVLGRASDPLPEGDLIVWGAGEGIELGLDLVQAGRTVRLLDPSAKLVPANYLGSRMSAINIWMAAAGLASEPSVTLQEVREGEVVVNHADGREETIPCAALIIAPGRVAYDPFSGKLNKSGVRLQVVGDARTPRSYGNAIHEAAYLARNI
jgi:pyruvate/2-oxoglutarate dehydrogenase complex dihydrolipoamide dehydrogenase (E3) component